MTTFAHPRDKIPPALRPLLAGYTRVGGAAFYGYVRLMVERCRFDIKREDIQKSLPNYIICSWHTWALPALAAAVYTQGGRPFAGLWHPAWQLVIAEPLGHKLGWRPVMGSSKHGGAEALAEIIDYLSRGYSTFLCPDGPYGPLHRPKRGAFEMALASGAPILPFRVSCDRALRLPRWDRFCMPLPGATIHVECMPPIHVTESNFAKSEAALIDALGD